MFPFRNSISCFLFLNSSGNIIGISSIIGKNVFIGPSAALTNDPYPPSEKLVGVIIEDNAIIGSKAVIKAGVTVGKNSVVAMGAVVINDVPPDTVVAGIPAKPKYSRDEYNKKQSEWKSI